jgi:signal transduction histidine kinase
MVFADRNLIQTVIRNLVSNAVKFTPAGGKIDISAKVNNDESIEVIIADSGIGMSPNMLERLFQLDAQTNRKGTEGEPSTGLGLIICHDFINRHGGKIRVESEEGSGTTFRFSLYGDANPANVQSVLL